MSLSFRADNNLFLFDQDAPWVLVLPAWGRVYHWKSRDLDQEALPWGTFFDLESLRKFVPVIEFEEFLKSEFCF